MMLIIRDKNATFALLLKLNIPSGRLTPGSPEKENIPEIEEIVPGRFI